MEEVREREVTELAIFCGFHKYMIHSETFRGLHEMKRSNEAPVKTNSSKGSSSFAKVGNIVSTSYIKHSGGIQKYP